jgi:hypothetical protein
VNFLDQDFFETVRKSLNRTKKYHKNALSKFKTKKPKQKDIDKFLLHRNEADACDAALEKIAQALFHLEKVR